MSHISSVAIVIQGMAALAEAIADAAATCRKERSFRTDDGKVHPVDLVVTGEDGATVGVKLDEKTGEATLVPYDCKGTKGKALANRIAQRYAYTKVKSELAKKGYVVAEERNEADGSIRLVAQRWR